MKTNNKFFAGVYGKAAFFLIVTAIASASFAETVGVFFDSNVPQHAFAAGDVKAALEQKSFTVEMKGLADLNASYANKKVVIALASNSAVTAVLTTQGGTAPSGLIAEAYGLRTTTSPQLSYWVLGADANGAMYGGFQVVENIKFNGYSGTYNIQEAPYLKERGEKLNMAFDKRSGTYPRDPVPSSSIRRGYENVWDYSFWTGYFDQMARYRYNMFTLWCNSPFTHMVITPGYTHVALADVQDSVDKVFIKMTINEKMTYWKKVMAYAKSRGFKFYIFTWNTYVGGADEIDASLVEGESTEAKTNDFIYKSMGALLETYPDLDGFGTTGGENINGSEEEKGKFFWAAYGKAMFEHLQKNPGRKLTFIQRMHMTELDIARPYFNSFIALPNATYMASYKYARAMMYSCATPTWWTKQGALTTLSGLNQRTFLTIRNDDRYFTHWGDPAYARTFINALPDPAKFTEGIYIGSDGFTPTRCFHVKDALYQNDLEINRLWYEKMIWGRMMYSPNTSDQVFKDYLRIRYPQVDANTLFTAWSNASKAFTVGNEFIRGNFANDNSYYPEGQTGNAYIPQSTIAQGSPVPGSKLTDYVVVADSVRKTGLAALAALNSMSAAGNEELRINIKSVKALACLALYVGEKIRGAEANQTGNKTLAQKALGDAYCIWKEYAKLMDEMHKGQYFTRVAAIWSWAAQTPSVLKDYNDVGGSGTPTCSNQYVGIADPAPVALSKKQSLSVRALSSGSITLNLPGELKFTIEIFSSNGAKVVELRSSKNEAGFVRLALGKNLSHGLYMVRLKSAGQTANLKMNVCCD